MRHNTNGKPFGITRRSMLKATAATTAGVALFAGSASASDETPNFTLECVGDEIRITLTSVDLYDGGSTSPTTLTDLEVLLGKRDILDDNDNGRIDRLAEIYPCFSGTSWCSPVASPIDEEINGTTIVYTFDRSDAGLDAVTGLTDVALIGTYTRERTPSDTRGSLDGTTTFDPAGCCTVCDSGTNLLVKYEWTGGELKSEGASDNGITLTSVDLDEDAEPKKACFTTTYCELWAVVKAGTNYDVIEVREDGLDPVEFCVEPTVKRAISNVQFFCEEPDEEDYELGNSNNSNDNRDNNGKQNGQGK